MKSKLIEIKNVSKKIINGKKDITILSEINFCVYRGEMLAITGKSGSGKSTLLSILAGLDAPTTGQINYEGEDLYKKNDTERFRLNEIGLIFQNYNLINELTCKQNIEVPLIFSEDKSIEEEQINLLLEKLDLKDKNNIYPSQLSGGEQQRVAIARAMIHKPSVIFADEPTGALDSKNADNIIQILQQYKEQWNAAVVVVTHDMDIANKCDRKLVLADGKMA